MSNHSPSLQEFICPIPICQSAADLGNMLDIFQHLNCDNLAIPNDQGGWGVIYAKDLLPLITEAWLGEQISLISHPRNGMSPLKINSRAVPPVQISPKSATTYRGDLKLTEFLARFQYDPLFWEQEVCLIVDRQGELQGQLDRNKMLAYLASSSLAKTNYSEPKTLTNLANLIDEIALPSRIETAQGKAVYHNQQWQLLEQTDSQILSPTVQPVRSDRDLDRMTKRWIESQKSISMTDMPEIPPGDRNCHQDLNWSWKQPSETQSGDRQNFGELEIEGELNWNYLKIPLTNLEGKKVHQEPYSLIIATPATKAEQAIDNYSTCTIDRTAVEILAAVSHELKSPLTGIVGLSNLLGKQQLGLLNQRQARYVELIHHSGKKMVRTIDDLLQLSTLITKSSSEMELINLEFLCRQLYQANLIKVDLIDGHPDSQVTFAQPKFRIESGSEVIVANESLLSLVLSHLMLEVLNDVSNSQLEIQVYARKDRTTAIEITSFKQHRSNFHDLGLNYILAEHLAVTMGAKITNQTIVRQRQLTLLLPQREIKPLPPVSSSDSQLSAVSSTEIKRLTILCLYPELEVIDPSATSNYDSNFDLKSFDDSCGLPAGCRHRLIEADSIEQAHNLARIWQIDAIILNGSQIAQPNLYLRSLQEYKHLASLPLITLDTKTTEAANQIEGLKVFPCLLPSQCRSIEDLVQVIQIALESE
ncbi:MAG: histidine kinase dimerization/phospho-acceptor domain-containing protein [Cyanobacteria bacterium J06600_6]